MKKKLFVFCFMGGITLVQAQLPFIGTATMIPQNPTPAAFIKIVTNVTTPNQGILVDIGHTVTGQQIIIKACYWQGMLPATQTHIDTFMIGQLPSGNYQVIQKAFMSTTQQWCNKTDSNEVRTAFTIPKATGIFENLNEASIAVYPNPTSGKLAIKAQGPVKEVYIFSSLGLLTRKCKVDESQEIDIRDLPEGVYFVRMISGGKNIDRKLIKTATE